MHPLCSTDFLPPRSAPPVRKTHGLSSPALCNNPESTSILLMPKLPAIWKAQSTYSPAGHFKKKFGIDREPAPFVFTGDMAGVIVRGSTVLFSAMQCSAVQCRAVYCSACRAVPSVQYRTPSTHSRMARGVRCLSCSWTTAAARSTYGNALVSASTLHTTL
jgi:hypothetical protein